MGDSCAHWLTALNEPHEFDKHEPVPKENRHEEGGESWQHAVQINR
jgi:hypothetical protein